ARWVRPEKPLRRDWCGGRGTALLESTSAPGDRASDACLVLSTLGLSRARPDDTAKPGNSRAAASGVAPRRFALRSAQPNGHPNGCAAVARMADVATCGGVAYSCATRGRAGLDQPSRMPRC